MKLNEKIRITEERLNSDERSYEHIVMCFLVGSFKAAPGYRVEILSSRETSFETFAVEVSVYMPGKKAAYATFYIELNSMNIQPAGTQDEPKMIYYRGSYDEYKENEYKVYCAAADFMSRMEQPTPEADTVVTNEPQPETPAAVQEAANGEPEATQEQTEEAKARELHARARELRERAEGLCEEGKLHENFVRSVQKVELQAYKVAAHESAVRLASKNPRVAAAMEHLRAKQAAPNDKPQVFEHKPAFEVGRVYRNEAQEAGKDTIKVTARSGYAVTFVWNGQEMTADVQLDDPDSEYILIGLKPFFASELEAAEEPAAGQPAPQEATTPEDRIDTLFHELVPVGGKADTVAGEIVRAVCRIGYRYSNDGDYVGCGYGKETCNPAARYLMANAGENVAEIVRCLWAAGEECGILDDGSYGDWLSELVRAALVYLDEHPELKATPNAEDYWNYRDPNEDVDEWSDEDEDEWGVA